MKIRSLSLNDQSHRKVARRILIPYTQFLLKFTHAYGTRTSCCMYPYSLSTRGVHATPNTIPRVDATCGRARPFLIDLLDTSATRCLTLTPHLIQTSLSPYTQDIPLSPHEKPAIMHWRGKFH